MLESDWKKISKMLPFLRERYLVDQTARLVRMLTERGKKLPTASGTRSRR